MVHGMKRKNHKHDSTVHELVMPNASESLYDIRAFTAATIAELHLAAGAQWDIVLAVGEAATNCVLHGQNGSGGRNTITTRIESTRDCVCARLRDNGPGFHADVGDWPAPDLTSEKGRGIFIIRTLMDEVEYPQVDTGALCVMTKRFRRRY